MFPDSRGWEAIWSASYEHNNHVPSRFGWKLPFWFHAGSVMAYSMFFGLLLLLSGSCWAQCPGNSRVIAHLQWSESAKVIAPDHSWIVEVHPILDADENHTPVTLHKCGESKSWPLFTLQRSAEMYWSSDSKRVLVIDQPLSGANKLLFFTVPGAATDTPEFGADTLERVVMDTLLERLGDGRKVQFYLPALLSWKDDNLVLSVGGETHTGNAGPSEAYCYGLRIDSGSLRVEDVLSDKQLKTRTGRGCQTSP